MKVPDWLPGASYINSAINLVDRTLSDLWSAFGWAGSMAVDAWNKAVDAFNLALELGAKTIQNVYETVTNVYQTINEYITNVYNTTNRYITNVYQNITQVIGITLADVRAWAEPYIANALTAAVQPMAAIVNFWSVKGTLLNSFFSETQVKERSDFLTRWNEIAWPEIQQLPPITDFWEEHGIEQQAFFADPLTWINDNVLAVWVEEFKEGFERGIKPPEEAV